MDNDTLDAAVLEEHKAHYGSVDYAMDLQTLYLRMKSTGVTIKELRESRKRLAKESRLQLVWLISSDGLLAGRGYYTGD